MYNITSPLPQFFDKAGSSLDNGYIYIGTAGANPETTPITVYWDKAGTQPAAQPIRTVNGYIARNGKAAKVWTSANDFSITVRESSGTLVYSESSATSTLTLEEELAASDGSSMIGFIQSGTGAVARTMQSKNREIVSVIDFGVIGDGVTDNTTALQNAINAVIAAGNTGRAGSPKLLFPYGTYAYSTGLVVDGGNIEFVFDGALLKYTGSGVALTVGNSSYLTDLAAGYYVAVFTGFALQCTNSSAVGVDNLGYRKIASNKMYVLGGNIGLRTEGAWNSSDLDIVCQNQTSYGMHIKHRNNRLKVRGAMLGAGVHGIYCSTSGAELKGLDIAVDFEGCALGALNITGNTGNVEIHHSWFENNATYNIRVDNTAATANKYAITIHDCQITGAGVDVLIGTDAAGTLLDGISVFDNEFTDSDLIVIGGGKVNNLREWGNRLSGTSTKTLPASGLATIASGVAPLYSTAPTEPYGFAASGSQGDIRYGEGRLWIKGANGWLLSQAYAVSDYTNSMANLPTGATPSVARAKYVKTANGSSTNVTSLSGGYATQEIIICGGDGGNTTIVHGSNIRLAGGANFTIGDNDTITLVCFDGTKWIEKCRSNNA